MKKLILLTLTLMNVSVFANTQAICRSRYYDLNQAIERAKQVLIARGVARRETIRVTAPTIVALSSNQSNGRDRLICVTLNY